MKAADYPVIPGHAENTVQYGIVQVNIAVRACDFHVEPSTGLKQKLCVAIETPKHELNVWLSMKGHITHVGIIRGNRNLWLWHKGVHKDIDESKKAAAS